jgi:hypothetical protein
MREVWYNVSDLNETNTDKKANRGVGLLNACFVMAEDKPDASMGWPSSSNGFLQRINAWVASFATCKWVHHDHVCPGRQVLKLTLAN